MPILAADLGGTTMKVGLVESGCLLETTSVPVVPARGLVSSLGCLEDTGRKLCAQRSLNVSDCGGLGLALACLVDGSEGRVLGSVQGKYEDAATVDLPAWVRDRLGLKLTLETDSRSALLGEWRYGAGRGCDNLVMVMLGTAIGVAVLLQGRLLRGVHYQAGLGGHVVVNPGGRLCNCGGKGCATAEASTWALPTIVRDSPGYQSSTLVGEPLLSYEAVFRQAKKGDVVARNVLERSLDVWAAMIVSLIHVFDPERVVLGGGIMQSAGEIMLPIQRRVKEWSWTPWGEVEVVLAHHLQNAALLGVSSLVDQGVAVL